MITEPLTAKSEYAELLQLRELKQQLGEALQSLRHAQRCIDGHEDDVLCLPYDGKVLDGGFVALSLRQGAVGVDLRKAIGLLEGK